MRKILLILFLLTIMSSAYAQNSSDLLIYFDENNNTIDQSTYFNKALKNIYREQTIEKDSVTIKKLINLYEFDSLNPTELKQAHKLLHKYLKINDFNKNIIIVYRDSLLGYNEFNASIDHKSVHDEMNNDTKDKYLKHRKSYDDNQKKCYRFAKKNNTTVVYGYSIAENFTYNPKNYTNEKIPNILKSVFFKDKKRGILILKPNGQFFFTVS